MSTIENTEIINSSNLSTKYGLIAGIVMTGVLLLFQLSGQDYSPFLKLSKYIILAIALVSALNIFKSNSSGDIFVNGMSLGIKLSIVAALLIVAVNVILFVVAPELSFSKYSLEPTNVMQLAMVSGVLFFETFVFGGIITFATLQFLKEKATL